MHILEIPSFFHPYGGLFCLEQAKALKECGNTVRILSNTQLFITIGLFDYITLPYNRRWSEMEGITVFNKYTRGIPKVIKPNVDHWIEEVLSMFEEYIKQYGKPDIIHAHCVKWAGYASMLISEKHNIPYAITEHYSSLLLKDEIERCGGITKAWQLPLLREANKKASIVMPVTAYQVENLAEYYGKDYKWESISNIIDCDFYSYKAREEYNNGQPFKIIAVADFIPLKAYDILLEAYAAFSKKHSNCMLNVLGRGTDTKKFGELTKHFKAPNVQGYGRVDKYRVRGLLQESHLLVHVSRSEAQPLAILEAISTGIPAIISEAIPPSSRIDEASTVVPVDDVKSVVEAMEFHYNNCRINPEFNSIIKGKASPKVIGQKLTTIFHDICKQCP